MGAAAADWATAVGWATCLEAVGWETADAVAADWATAVGWATRLEVAAAGSEAAAAAAGKKTPVRCRP